MSKEIENSPNLDESVSEMKYIRGCSSNELRIFNVKTSTFKKRYLPKNQNLDMYGAKCLLPDGSLFYDNGPITIIIDPNYRIKTLPHYSAEKIDACAVYKDNEIYLFGGLNDYAAKFSLLKNKWTRLINLPIRLASHSFGAVFKNYILLVSMYSDNIIYYDTEICSYSYILSLNLTFMPKVIFVENEDVYISESSKYIFRSSNNLVTWYNIGNSKILSGNAPIISIPVTYDQKIYFANHKAVYSFDLRNKSIEKVKAAFDPS